MWYWRCAKFTLSLALLSAVGLVGTGGSNAAVIYEIRLEPRSPRVGDVVAISVSTFAADSPRPGVEPEPLPLDDFPWTFVADPPDGAPVAIPLARDGVSRHRWIGTFVFTKPGRWEIGLDERHLGSPPDPALGARVEVVVTSDDVAATPLPLVVALGVLVLIAVLAVQRVRARWRA